MSCGSDDIEIRRARRRGFWRGFRRGLVEGMDIRNWPAITRDIIETIRRAWR